MTQPGEDITWTACLSVAFSDRVEINYIMDQIRQEKRSRGNRHQLHVSKNGGWNSAAGCGVE